MSDYIANLAAQTTFDAAYWASQPPAIAALQGMDPGTRLSTAQQLALSGFIIDVQIMAWGWDAYNTMLARQAYGYTWVPSALQQPVEVLPGITFPGLPTYNPNPPYPAGSIVVSTNPADYPPYAPVAPVTPAPASTALVGINIFGTVYAATTYALQQVAAGTLLNGATTTVNGQTFSLLIGFDGVGQVVNWVLTTTPAA